MRLPLVLLVLGLAVPAGAPAASPGRCEDRAGRTLAQSTQARAFSLPGRDAYRSVLVCRLGSRRTVRIGNAGECMTATRIDEVLAAGRYVAFRATSCGLTSGDALVGLVDVVGGRRLWAQRAFAGPTPPDGSSTSASELALTSSGTVTWLGRLDAVAIESHVRTARGEDQVRAS